MERRRRTQQEFYEDEGWYDADPVEQEPYREQVEEIVATNRTVQLACTLAAMMPLFALFLIFAEKKAGLCGISRCNRWGLPFAMRLSVSCCWW